MRVIQKVKTYWIPPPPKAPCLFESEKIVSYHHFQEKLGYS